MPDGVPAALDAIKRFVEAARKDPRFTVMFDEFAYLSTAAIEEWQAFVGEQLAQPAYRIPDALLEVYAATGGFDLQWTLDIQDRRISGTCRIASLFGLYQRDEENDVPISECVRSLRPFDRISEEECVLIAFEDGAAAVRRMLYRDGKAKSGMSLPYSPASYVIEAARHLGIYGWQLGRQDGHGEALVRSTAGRHPGA